jgi:uncharacterized membrane protein YoaK (UPF0700 family)
MACGLQNALATQYSAAVVRTTHITGIVTDLGIALGKFVAGRGVDGWRVWLYLGLLFGFASGGAAGGQAFHALGVGALWVPAIGVGTLGAGYTAARIVQRARSPDGGGGGARAGRRMTGTSPPSRGSSREEDRP